MAKDYRRKQVRQRSIPRQLFWLLAAFLGGYLTATVFDFTSLTTWVNTHVLTHHNEEQKTEAKVAAKPAELPKPKFEFYTLLAKDHATPVSVKPLPTQAKMPEQPAPAPSTVPVIPSPQPQVQSAAPVVEAKPAADNSKGVYQLQVASFRKRQDAEHLKAKLILKGFNVSVVATLQRQLSWFRVVIGPFHSRNEAEKTKLDLVRNERITGMIRRMDA